MIWIAPLLWPLVVALLIALPGVGSGVKRVLVPLTPLPALGLALFGPADGGAFFESLVLGLRLGFGTAGQVFLLFTSVVWLIAALYAQGYLVNDARRTRFHGFFLLTMTGNLGLILAQDVPAFYTFFALMTFSAFGLVTHTGTEDAKRAARIYLITAVAGEALLLGAIFLAVGAADSVRLEDLAPAVAVSEERNLIILLAFFGFGVKAGTLPVHFWLALAHPVAPAPASATLSGAMIKAGLLGWMHFLPLGQGPFPAWGLFCIVTGLAAAFGAVIAGYAQEDPKTILAYSSISQMGLMTLILGIGLTGSVPWAGVLPVVLLYALNHALAKSALFLGTGIAQSTGRTGGARWLVGAGLAVSALTIAGAPWTGGALAKEAMKDLAAGLPGGLVPWLDWLLPLGSAATALLLGRFLWLVWREMQKKPEGRAHVLMWLSWLVLLLGVVTAGSFAPRYFVLEIAPKPFSAAAIWAHAWPILLGLAMLLVLESRFAGMTKRFTIPPGDLVVGLEGLAIRVHRAWRDFAHPQLSRWQINLFEPLEHLAESERHGDFTNRIERSLRNQSVAGVLFMLLVLALVALLILGTPVR